MRNSPQANIDILTRILKYCKNIEKLIERFGKDYTIFQNDLAYKDAISMNILQIDELSGHLSEEYRIATKDRMPWKSIKSMRNFSHIVTGKWTYLSFGQRQSKIYQN